MTIVISLSIVPEHLLNELEKKKNPKVYSTMNPIQSPYFLTYEEIILWFNSLPFMDRMKFTEKDHLFIYSHYVNLHDQVLPHGYKAKAGEILSTDEAYVYQFSTKKWHWEDGFTD